MLLGKIISWNYNIIWYRISILLENIVVLRALIGIVDYLVIYLFFRYLEYVPMSINGSEQFLFCGLISIVDNKCFILITHLRWLCTINCSTFYICIYWGRIAPIQPEKVRKRSERLIVSSTVNMIGKFWFYQTI